VAMVSAPQRLCVNNWCLMLSPGNRSGQHSHTDIDTQSTSDRMQSCFTHSPRHPYQCAAARPAMWCRPQLKS
jgi:hypothetical protein